MSDVIGQTIDSVHVFHMEQEIRKLRVEVDRLQSRSVTELCADYENLQDYITQIEANYHHMKTERDAAVKDAAAALRQYGQHLPMCRSNVLLTSMPPQRQPCDCGLNVAIDAAQGEKL